LKLAFGLKARHDDARQTCGPLAFSNIRSPSLPILFPISVLTKALFFLREELFPVDYDHGYFQRLLTSALEVDKQIDNWPCENYEVEVFWLVVEFGIVKSDQAIVVGNRTMA
jgi:hypothetical protein